jgi:integral membrane sensor domain MASE1/anti-sigma regulatory factor (Ser/Thr protein kinase)
VANRSSAAMDSDRKLYAAKIVGIAAVYYGAAKLGLSLAFASKSVTAVWPPTGIALAALVLLGYRFWPGVALGAFFANLGTGVPFYTVLGITTGNTLEALAGAYLLLRLADFRPSLERVRDVIALVALGGIVSTTVSATIGVSSLLVGNEIDAGNIGATWRTWWLGDMGGDLVVAPALLVAATHGRFRRAPGTLLEAVGLALAVTGVAALVFTHDVSLTFLVIPPVIWAALRFWQAGAAGASVAIAAIAVPLTESNSGPFSGYSPDDRLLLAQAFVGVTCLTGLILAAVITERRRVEDTVEHIAGTLQESLLPSHLPIVPGVETAVDFRPAGERHLVGGDFYDLFESDDGSWAVVVGDVCGKGAAAAAVTGLARYTLRAAAVEHDRPSRILGLLNDAILRQRGPYEFCTVAFARLELDGGAGARVTASCGGHPLPLVLRADGAVEPLGRPGTLLGVQREPSLADYTAELAPGDAMVLYTDGLTDAYAPARIVSSADLTSILESCAGRSAPEIAAGLQGALLDTAAGEPRDDIALFVLRIPLPAERGEREVTLQLTPEPEAIAVARDAIRALETELNEAAMTNLRLLVSELVTNSVRHAGVPAGESIALRIGVSQQRVRVEVGDLGPGFQPPRGAPVPQSPSGWGLYLVDQLAERWGVLSDGGTRVWFEIDR